MSALLLPLLPLALIGAGIWAIVKLGDVVKSLLPDSKGFDPGSGETIRDPQPIEPGVGAPTEFGDVIPADFHPFSASFIRASVHYAGWTVTTWALEWSVTNLGTARHRFKSHVHISGFLEEVDSASVEFDLDPQQRGEATRYVELRNWPGPDRSIATLLIDGKPWAVKELVR